MVDGNTVARFKVTEVPPGPVTLMVPSAEEHCMKMGYSASSEKEVVQLKFTGIHLSDSLTGPASHGAHPVDAHLLQPGGGW